MHTEDLQHIYESQYSTLYTGPYQDFDRDVLIKVLNSESPTEEQLIRFHHEYELTAHLDIAGVRKALRTDRDGETHLVILEYVDGQPLKALIHDKTLDLGARLRIAYRIAHILGEIHQQHIIHRAITADNILIDADHDAHIIDFGLAVRDTLHMNDARLAHPEHLEGTLQYMSPEQSGRMNRRVDYRSDIYSLGIVLYELFSQRLPFDERDPLELIHAHVAKKPVPPDEINPEIPGALSECLVKLLAKNAEERYQSAFGLCRDLEYIRTQLDHADRLDGFTAGEHDFSGRLCLPEKLYARERETQQLLELYEQVCHGDTQLVSISGAAGVGKSALVHGIQAAVTAEKGLFLEGHFDRFQKNIPYSAILQAFRDFIRQVLQENDEILHDWRELIQHALGEIGGALTSLVPDLELIIGPQPELPTLEGRDARNRFNYVWRNFIKAIARAEHPLVIFLDDLQWADVSSRELLKDVLSDREIHHLFCMTASRRHDGNQREPAEDDSPTGISSSTMHLENLQARDVASLLRDALAGEHAQPVQLLADVVHSKTAGNAFFTIQFVNTLSEEGLLAFDFQHNHWTWNLEEIETQHITDNVVELLSDKVRKLPHDTQAALRIAACIGDRFELKLVSAICQHDDAQTRKDLEPAVFANLIIPLDRHQFHFAHERIHHAVYAGIPEEKKQTFHARIGSMHLAALTPDELEKRLFDVVNQCNAGRESLTHAETQQLYRLNFRTALKAKQASAYSQGYQYAMMSRDLLPPDAWQLDYNGTLRVYEELAELAYLSNRHDRTEEYVRVIQQHATDILHTVNAQYTLINSYRAQSKLQHAVEAGVTLLGHLGLPIPMHPSKAYIAKEFLHTQLAVGTKKADFFDRLPAMSDPKQLAIVKILDTLGSCLYLAAPDLLPIISWKFMRISARYGNSMYSGSCYSGYSIILAVMNQTRRAVEFAGLAETICLRFDARHLRVKPVLLKNYIILVWTQRLHTIVPALETVYKMAMEAGDLEYAGYGLCNQFLAFYTNVPLQQLHKQQLAKLPALHHTHQLNSLRFFALFLQSCESLISPSQEPCAIQGEYFDEDRDVELLRESHDSATLFNFYTNKLFLCLVYDDLRFAERYIVELETYMMADQGSYFYAVGHFYLSLTALRLYEQDPGKSALLKKVRTHQRLMKKWAKSNPMSFQHKCDLLEAERLRLQGKTGRAGPLYDKAIFGAKKQEYLSDEALAWHCAALFYRNAPTPHPAQYYMQQSYERYHAWEAFGVCHHLAECYPEYVRQKSGGVSHSRDDTDSALSSRSARLDITSIMKAAQSLAEEVKLEQLLKRMLTIVMENTGAQYGVIIKNTDGKFTIEAKGTHGVHESDVLQSQALEDTDAVAANIVKYVIRTRKFLVVDHACEQGNYSENAYIQQRRVKSVLCYPVIHHNALVALLYLENNLSSYVFTAERIETLTILSSQIAVSLENAMMYQTLEQKVKERTAELAQAKDVAEDARKAAELASQAKSIFLTNMTHELRSPLNAILGFAQLSLRNKRLGQEDEENLNMIARSGERLLFLIEQVLDLSKIEAGRMTLDPQDVNLGRLLDDVEDMFRVKAERKGVQLLFERTPNLPLSVRADDVKLRQVLINLLNNAVKFTERGSVTVRVSSIINDQLSMINCQLHVEIEDTGPGIAPEELDRLFEAFTQTSSPEQWREGSGLGLAISHTFVQLMGGDLQVQSRLGEGTTFRFDIELECLTDEPAQIAQTNPQRVIALEPEPSRHRIPVAELPAAIAQLPPELPEQLQYAVEHSDLDLIDRVLAEIRASQPAAADILADWADNFQYERIVQFLQEGHRI